MIKGADLLGCRDLKTRPIVPEHQYRIATDSRKINGQNLFISLYGPNFDSINFIPDVFSKGIEKVILESRDVNKDKINDLKSKFGPENIFEVSNVFQLLLELGNIRSKRFQNERGILIGLTGSNGKTTNKEMLNHLLSVFGEEEIWSTQGNLNNQIGVPLTLFELEDRHKVAVVEMGTSFPGEIEVLAKCACPKFGFITNIGHAHIEFLKSLDGVFEEKSALYQEIAKREDGLFLVNGFDEFLMRHKGKPNTQTLDASTFSFTNDGFQVTLNGKTFSLQNDTLLGDHQKLNMGMCLTLLSIIFPDHVDEFVEKSKSYRPPGMNRGEVVTLGDSTFYMDAYNANPNSMEASLRSYAAYLDNKNKSPELATFILGDMNELGEKSAELHKEVGKTLSELGAKTAIFVGRFAKDYAKGFSGDSKSFTNVAELKSYLVKLQTLPKEAFVKGSRSLQLESILDITVR